MKRTVCLLAALACVGALASFPVLGQSSTYGFGFGGAMAMAFFPEMDGINTFLSENALPPMGDVLFGAGGSGRGGVIGGPAAGGIGWGLVAEVASDVRQAELVFGGGGFDIGSALGGDDSSVLTLGVVLGGGAVVLSLTEAPDDDGCDPGPNGFVPQPTVRELGRAIGFVQPYLSMSAQLLPWLGFELRLGYVLPVFGFEFGDLTGIPSPSLDLAGPTVSLGFVFGGIGSVSHEDDVDERDEGRAEVTLPSVGEIAISPGGQLVVENGLGDMAIASLPVGATQTAASSIVTWRATRTAQERRIDALQVIAAPTDTGAMLKTVGSGRVDYDVLIPPGVDVAVRNSVGRVVVNDLQGQTVIIENGVGDVELAGVRAAALIVAGGVGRLTLTDIEAAHLIADVGLGDIDLTLPADASATLTAEAGLGEIVVDRFPGMIGGVRGFLRRSADLTLGGGGPIVDLEVGLGKIVIRAREP